MRRHALPLALGLTLLVFPAVSLGSHSDSGGGPRDFAVGGGGNTSPFPNQVGFAAQADPVTGHFRAKGDLDGDGPMGPFALEGEVTCLLVAPSLLDGQATRASIRYRFKHAEGSAEGLEGGGIQVFVEDRGEPVGGQPVDGAAFREFVPPGAFVATACQDPNSTLYDPIEWGNITVHDAP
jgi:hypothetical protein